MRLFTLWWGGGGGVTGPSEHGWKPDWERTQPQRPPEEVNYSGSNKDAELGHRREVKQHRNCTSAAGENVM